MNQYHPSVIRIIRGLAFLGLLCLVFLVSCGGNRPGNKQDLEPPARPDFDLLSSGSNFPVDQLEKWEQQAVGDDDSIRADAFGRIGMLYHAYNLYDNALQAYLMAREINKDDPRWIYLSGLMHRQKGDTKAAREALEETIRVKPQNAAALVALADLEFLDGLNNRARNHYQQALDMEVDQTAALIGLGKVAAVENDHNAAVDYFQRAIDREPEATVVHYMLAQSWRKLGDDAKASYHMGLRGEVQPVLDDPLIAEILNMRTDGETMFTRGSQLVKVGRHAEALIHFQEALQASPEDPRIWINMGLCYRNLGNYDLALQAYNKVLSIATQNSLLSFAHYCIGDLMDVVGRSASAHYKQATTLNPDEIGYLFRYAESIRVEGQLEQALELLEQVLVKNPDNIFAKQSRALALIQLGRWTDVRRHLESDVEAHPDLESFKHMLARVLAASPDQKVRDGQEAVRIIQELSRARQGVGISETFGMALAETGRFTEAVAHQNQAIAQAVAENLPHAHLQRQLLAYTKNKPNRTPWAKNAPFFARKTYEGMLRNR